MGQYVNKQEVLWSGIVRIDDSFDDHATSVADSTDSKNLIIKDVTFAHNGVGSIDTKLVPYNKTENGITISIKGKEIYKIMNCKVLANLTLWVYEQGIFKKTTHYYVTDIKYHVDLSPTAEQVENPPSLASFKARLGGMNDNYINIHQHGLVSAYSGSRSAETPDAARKSLTILFIAGKTNPFVATVREKGIPFNVHVDHEGFKEKPANYGGKKEKKSTKPTQDPLEILKLRLVKGEITLEEFEKFKKALE